MEKTEPMAQIQIELRINGQEWKPGRFELHDDGDISIRASRKDYPRKTIEERADQIYRMGRMLRAVSVARATEERIRDLENLLGELRK